MELVKPLHWIIVVIILGAVASMTAPGRVVLAEQVENIAYLLDPSAVRAFEYGERQFSSSDSAQYDIERAEHFFHLAASKDPSLPYAYHELARISFLKGDLRSALSQIDLQISMHSDKAPNSYYVRGLIEGYMGLYELAIEDYKLYLAFDPHNWAAINDYAWVLLKAGRAEEVVRVTDDGLKYFPDNAWLLNSSAIALYEVGDIERARDQAKKALIAASKVSEKQWLTAYPGNDPRIAEEGISTFIEAARENMHTIVLASASSALQ
jgi:tetratricopeptide (TPR) repeat protein